MTPRPQVSIVLPVYNEVGCLGPLLDELTAVMQAFGRTFEILAIDDGSTDGSADLLLGRAAASVAAGEGRLIVVRFGRNYGQAAAFDAGFCRARAPLVVTLDADGQNDPADIPMLIDYLEANKLDFVSGNRRNRQDHAVRRKLPSRIANALIRTVTRTRVRDLGCSLKVYRTAVLREIRLYGEMHRFLAVLVEGAGARVGQLDVGHRPRTAGVSKYGLSRTFKVLLDLITVWFMRGFQTSPIYAFGTISGLLFVGGVVLSAYTLLDKFAYGVFVHRNPLFILSMVMAIMSVQFLAMGLIAELMIRTYFEARGRPAYCVIEETSTDAGPKPELFLAKRPLARASGPFAPGASPAMSAAEPASQVPASVSSVSQAAPAVPAASATSASTATSSSSPASSPASLTSAATVTPRLPIAGGI